MKTKILSLILLSLLFAGCDKIDKPTAEIRLQKLFPNCQVFESEDLKQLIDSPRISVFIIKTQDGKIYYIQFFGNGMNDPVECFPAK